MRSIGGYWPPSTADVITNVAKLYVGSFHSCVILATDGQLRCWGYNANGQLGLGHTANRFAPSSRNVLMGVDSAGLGAYYSCAIMATAFKELYCWGSNMYGQLGTGGPGPDVLSPPSMPLFSNVNQVVGGLGYVWAACGV